jgi:hypothetical protein
VSLRRKRRLSVDQLRRIRDVLQSALAAGGDTRGQLDPLARGGGGIAAFLRARGGDVGGGFLDSIAREASTGDGGVSEGTVRALLDDLLLHGSPPQALFTDETLRSAVETAAAQALSRNGTPADPAEVREAIELLRSGQVLRDLDQIVGLVVRFAPEMANAVLTDLTKLPGWLVTGGLLIAIGRDVAGTLRELPSAVGELLHGDFHASLPSETLIGLYQNSAAARGIAQDAGTLLDNPSFRLALVLYARSQGVPITEEDLRVVRATVLNVDNPDLGPLISYAADRAREHFGQPQIEAALQRLIGSSG